MTFEDDIYHEDMNQNKRSFEDDFPSFKNADYIQKNHCFYIDTPCVWKNCLDKQRVKEAIEKLRSYIHSNFNDCDDINEKIINNLFDDTLKDLGME